MQWYHSSANKSQRTLNLPPIISIRFTSLNHPLDLEESLDPPNLEGSDTNDDSQLESAPPFDSAIGALCGVSVYSFSQNDVFLLILDLCEEFGQLTDFVLEWVGAWGPWGWLWNVDDTVDVETDFLVGTGVGFVAEAVGVTAVHCGGERVVAAGGCVVLGEEGTGRILNLDSGEDN